MRISNFVISFTPKAALNDIIGRKTYYEFGERYRKSLIFSTEHVSLKGKIIKSISQFFYTSYPLE